MVLFLKLQKRKEMWKIKTTTKEHSEVNSNSPSFASFAFCAKERRFLHLESSSSLERDSRALLPSIPGP
jgi:hypothetical protein